MHVYGSYAAPSAAAEVDFVRQHPFAVVVSASDGAAPVGTHVPVIFPQDRPLPATLDGATMLGHMGRANPHWRSFTEGLEVLLIFSGQHGYVSPTAYGYNPAVPTLNYAAVHVTATVELVEGTEENLHVVEETVRALESLRDPAWDMAPSKEKFASIVAHVASFLVRVTSVRSMFKLSQDMPPHVRANVRADLRDTGGCPHLADMMAEFDPDG